MIYKNPKQAYLFEAVVGFLTLLLCLVVGKFGYVVLALMVLRPMLLETDRTKRDQIDYWIYFHAMRLSVYFAGSAILFTVLAFQFRPFTSYDKTLLITLIIPWFVLAHGFIGYFVARTKRIA